MDRSDQYLEEARALIARAEEEGLRLRLLGGLAVRALCPSSRREPFQRQSSDIDFASLGASARIEAFFASQGAAADREFNLYHGAERLLFRSAAGTKVDVFVKTFKMCHAIPLSEALAADSACLAPAELLLTKLQVVECNEKDLSDSATLLLDLGSSEGGEGLSIDHGRIAALCAADWGLWRTVTGNLAKLEAWLRAIPGGACAEDRSSLLRTIEALRARMHAEPKSLAFRMRAAVGDKLRWYELPEELGA